MGVRDLAKKLGMHHSVVHRIVSTFEQHGVLIQNRDTQKYHLGLKLLEYGKVVTDQLNIQQYFQPILKEIANSTGESVYLNMLEGKEGVCVSIVLRLEGYSISDTGRRPFAAVCRSFAEGHDGLRIRGASGGDYSGRLDGRHFPNDNGLAPLAGPIGANQGGGLVHFCR